LPTQKRFLPYLALAAAVLALTFSSLFIRWADAPGTVTAFYRMAIGSLAFLPFFLRQPAARRRVDRRWLYLLLLGGLFTALDHASWSTAVEGTRVANATLLNNLAPLWVALVAMLVWRERLPGGFWFGLVMAIGGAAVVLGSDFLVRPQLNGGNLLALVSSLFYAAYFLTTQRGREHFSTITYVFSITLVCSLVLLAINLGQGKPLSGYSGHTYLVFLAAGLISQVIGYFSTAYALGHLPASVVSPTMISQPVLTALLAIPFAGESLALSQVLGGLVVLAGIYLINRSREKSRNQATVHRPEGPLPAVEKTK
jgi:drug/metabolite transporter (DMT)-like permease